jgi:hypothetical protein
MSRIVLAIASLLLTASCATQLAQTPPPNLPVAVSAPEFRAGSYWRFAVSDGFTRLPRGTIGYRVDKIDAVVVTVQVTSDAGETAELYTRNWNWLQRPATNLQVFAYSPAYRAFDFPLSAGKKWTFRGAARDPADGRTFPVRIEGEVLGWERVKVPAGEFETLKVRRYVTLDYWLQGVRGQSVITETDWYAPTLNQVARREATSQYLRLADASPMFVRVRGGRSRDGDGDPLPRYEQDDWLVYELVEHGRR